MRWALLVALLTFGQFGASRTALVTVSDPRGRAIVDIEADDFVVKETAQAREVLSVRVADYPVAVVLDTSAGAAQDAERIRQAAARFIGRIGHRPIAVATSDPPRLIATFDDDRSVVMDALERTSASPAAEGLFEAIVEAARAISENGTPFSAIVVVSSTPLATVPGELLTPILESGATLHAVVAGGSQQPATSKETLRALADQTHGQFTTIFSSASYPAALDRLADRLAPQLLVEYVVPSGSTSGNDVQLGVKIPGARVIGLGVK
jgi:hypothetical protein